MCYFNRCSYRDGSGCSKESINIPIDAECMKIEIRAYKNRKREMEQDLKFLMIKDEYGSKIKRAVKLKNRYNNLQSIVIDMIIFYELLSIYILNRRVEQNEQ